MSQAGVVARQKTPVDRTRRHGGVFEFDRAVRDAAWVRQSGRCAVAGESLEKVLKGEDWDEDNDRIYAHHIVPVQSATPSSTDDRIVRSVDNCVILCKRCHWHVHQFGWFRDGACAPPDFFAHSHGRINAAGRKEWVAKMMTFWIQKYDPVASAGEQMPSGQAS